MLAIFRPAFAILGCVILLTVVQAVARLNGSLIERERVVFGSPLIAPVFTAPGYFHPRPSAVAYDAASAGASAWPGASE